VKKQSVKKYLFIWRIPHIHLTILVSAWAKVRVPFWHVAFRSRNINRERMKRSLREWTYATLPQVMSAAWGYLCMLKHCWNSFSLHYKLLCHNSTSATSIVVVGTTARQLDCWERTTTNQLTTWRPVTMLWRRTSRPWLIVGLLAGDVDPSTEQLLAAMIQTVLATTPALNSSTVKHRNSVPAIVLSIQRRS